MPFFHFFKESAGKLVNFDVGNGIFASEIPEIRFETA
jgi:hypothetical protein